MKFVDIKKKYTQCVKHAILAGYTQCVYTNVIGNAAQEGDINDKTIFNGPRK